MLSYQHIYHAGNFADVQKHAIFAQVLKSLRIKPTPMTVLDTHAGRGLYGLGDAEADKNREFDNGITALWSQRDTLPAVLKPYMDVVAAQNADGVLAHYPGTAFIAREMLRPTDRLIAVERHPGEYQFLRQTLAGKPRCELLQDDGLKILSEKVPFPERRGVIVIDPSYEIKSEYTELPKVLLKAYKKWPQACYVIWYPCMSAGGHTVMLSEILKSGIRDVLVSEIHLDVPPEQHFRMYGSGIAIINPPWPDAVMRDITDAVTQHLPAPAVGNVFWLDNRHIDPDTGLIAPSAA